MAIGPRPTADDRIKAALWFAERGFGVFSTWSTNAQGICRCPKGAACESPGKHPVSIHGFKDATQEPAKIRTLLAARSEPNYGLVCPEGVFALDVDGDGIERLAELERTLGPLPATLRTATAHGEHIFLRWPNDFPRPIGYLFGFVTRWGSGNNAGYVIGPRSVHASGAVYAPAEGSAFDIADLPGTWARSVVDKESSEPFITVEAGGYQLPDFGYTGERYGEILRFIASRYMRGITKDEIWTSVRDVLAPRFEEQLAEPDLRARFDRAWGKTPERLGQPIDFTAADIAGGATIAHLPGWPDPPADAAYHGILGEIVEAVTELTEADRVGILATLLATAGACFGHGHYLYQGSPQTPNLFVVLVGETASGRKGTAGSVAREVMRSAYPEWEQLIVAGLGSGEGLISHLKRNEGKEHRALVLESEFGRLLTVMAREGSTLSPVVRDAWDGVPMGRFLAREQQLVTWHHVGIVAHITPVELRARLSGTDAANGFGNRFLWLAVRRSQLVPFPESPKAVIAPFVQAFGRALVEGQMLGELHWSSTARDRWAWLYATISGQPRHGLVGALAARAEAQIARLALVYALLDRSTQVDVEHLLAAEAVWAYAERTIGYVFGPSTGNRHADALRDYLADGPLEWEQAKKAIGVRYAMDLREAVDLLVSLGLADLVQLPRDGGGRPRRVIRSVGTNHETLQKTVPASTPKTT